MPHARPSNALTLRCRLPFSQAAAEAANSAAGLSRWEVALFSISGLLFVLVMLAMFLVLSPHDAARLLGEPLHGRLLATPPLKALRRELQRAAAEAAARRGEF